MKILVDLDSDLQRLLVEYMTRNSMFDMDKAIAKVLREGCNVNVEANIETVLDLVFEEIRGYADGQQFSYFDLIGSVSIPLDLRDKLWQRFLYIAEHGNLFASVHASPDGLYMFKKLPSEPAEV